MTPSVNPHIYCLITITETLVEVSLLLCREPLHYTGYYSMLQHAAHTEYYITKPIAQVDIITEKGYFWENKLESIPKLYGSYITAVAVILATYS